MFCKWYIIFIDDFYYVINDILAKWFASMDGNIKQTANETIGQRTT